MPRTIEERLQELLDDLNNPLLEEGVHNRAVLAQLIADFRSEGIAHRTIVDSREISHKEKTKP